MQKSILILIFICLSIIGCDNGSSSHESEINARLRSIIAEKNLTGNPSVGRDLPDIDDPLAQLGMKLFYTKALGGDYDAACVTCHHPALGGGDGLSLPIGIDALNPDLLGLGRMHSSGSPNVPRNAPTTFNIALWDQVLFWDGRVESLGKTAKANGGDDLGIRTPDTLFNIPDPNAGDNLVMAQSKFPVTAVDEMRGFELEKGNGNEDVWKHLAARVGDYGIGKFGLNPNEWLSEFQNAFQSDENSETLIIFENIALAISTYGRSQVFVDNAWRDFVNGDDDALTKSEKQGALLFFESVEDGGVGCSQCHSGDFFTDEQFHVLAIPQIGEGKEDGSFSDDDFGRYRETSDPLDRYAFRTPSLLNVEVTGPYSHSGAYATLEGMVRHILNPWEAVSFYDYSQVDPSIDTTHMEYNTNLALEKLDEKVASGISPIQKISLDDSEVENLISFLLTFTDPCVRSRECFQKWIPDDSINDPDGLRLNAIDINGDTL